MRINLGILSLAGWVAGIGGLNACTTTTLNNVVEASGSGGISGSGGSSGRSSGGFAFGGMSAGGTAGVGGVITTGAVSASGGVAGLAGTGSGGGDPAGAGGMPSDSGGAPSDSGGSPSNSGGAPSDSGGIGGGLAVGKCGDALVNAAGEECDYGADNSDIGVCTTQCKSARCGDGLVQTGKEACDAREATATCDADCTLPVCGDGIVNKAAGEACDDGANNGKANQCDKSCLYVCEGACPLRVDPTLTAGGDGSTWATAYNSLASAITTQWDRGGGQIWTKIGSLPGPITLRRGVMVFGGFSGTEKQIKERASKQYTTITGGSPVVTGASSARLDGFAITDGLASKRTAPPYVDGGGMLNSNVTGLVVSNCRFQKNSALEGGGAMFNTSSALRIEDVVFLENTANQGGAIYNRASSKVEIVRSRFESNTTAPGLDSTAVTYGGALYNESSDITVADSVFVANKAMANMGVGGAVYSSGSSPSFTGVVFFKNSAFSGGALANTSTVAKAPSIINCLFAENVNSDMSSKGSGGLVDLASAGSKIVGTTFAFNTGPGNLNLLGTTTTTCTNCAVVGQGSGTNTNLTTTQLISSCALLIGNPGSPATPFLTPVPDGDSDGIPEYVLNQVDANSCFNKGNDAASTAAGIPWATSTTSSNACLDTSPVDCGFHYLSSSTKACL